MKNLFLFLLLFGASFAATAQDFVKNMDNAKSAYAKKELSNARFAMQQMLYDVDAAIGKEILTMLPTKMAALPVNEIEDNVSGNGAGITAGLFVTRTYGTDSATAELQIINNSPLISSLSALLSMPLMGLASDDNQKVVKVHGYKSMLYKHQDNEPGKLNYELQVPFNNTLLTFNVRKTTEAEILELAETIPLPRIAKLVQ